MEISHGPAQHGPIQAGGGQILPIGAEAEPVDRGPMAPEHGGRPSIIQPPEADGLIFTGGGEEAAVGAEGKTLHLVRVAGHGLEQLALRTPELDGAVVTG